MSGYSELFTTYDPRNALYAGVMLGEQLLRVIIPTFVTVSAPFWA